MRIRKLILLVWLLLLNGCGGCVNIWKAVENEDLEAITQYAKSGGDLNTGATFYGKTPLFHALILGKKKSYETLLDLGANPNTLCRNNASVLHYAVGESDTFWLKRGLAGKGNPDLVNTNDGPSRRGSLLWGAITSRRLENVRILLDSGANIDAYVHRDFTPLSCALDWPCFDVALLLTRRGANYLKTARMEHTAIHLLREKMGIVKSSITHKQKFPYSETDLKALDQIVEFLKADGFDPETAVWDGRELIWKQP